MIGALLTLSLAAATLCAMTARFLWLGDLAVHFRLQYAVLGLIGTVLFLVVRQPEWAALSLAVAVFNGIAAVPAMTSRQFPVAHAALAGTDPQKVRVVAINVLYASHAYRRVEDVIHHERPDVVVLVEMNARWHKGLEAAEREYPHRYQTRGASRRGVTLWSRFPMTDVGELPMETHDEPAIGATLQIGSRTLRVFAIHTSWPMWPAASRRRNLQLVRMADLARATPMPLVAVGDLNITPFSPHFQQLLANGRLRSAAEGFGWVPTWPVFLPPAGIQIDHGLVNAEVRVQSFRRGSTDGSDHRPIILDLLL